MDISEIAFTIVNDKSIDWGIVSNKSQVYGVVKNKMSGEANNLIYAVSCIVANIFYIGE